MSVGDFFYLTHGNDIQLFGRISSVVINPRARWIEREYVTVRTRQSKSGHFDGVRRGWAPNSNTTCRQVPEHQLNLFERQLLSPFFRLRLYDLKQLRTAFAEPQDSDTSISAFDVEYEEAFRRRVKQHEGFETVRNRELVIAAKRAFKRAHGRLFCQVCDFDFSATYGKHGKDYIEAHHLVPMAQLSGKTRLKIKDLAMVCANCHRMLHQPPQTNIKKLRMLLL
jgi:hypothetical protein